MVQDIEHKELDVSWVPTGRPISLRKRDLPTFGTGDLDAQKWFDQPRVSCACVYDTDDVEELLLTDSFMNCFDSDVDRPSQMSDEADSTGLDELSDPVSL